MPWKPSKPKPVTLLAALIIIGCFGLMAGGIDGVVHTVLITVVVYYFGQVSTQKRDHRDE